MKSELLKGIVSTAIGKYSNIFFQLLITGVLARMLSPKEFGIVTVVNVFIVFFTMIGEMGIGPAIIQNKTLSSNEYNEIFFFSCILGVFIAIFFSILGLPAKILYNESAYYVIFPLLSIATFFNVISMTPRSILMKNKEFMYANIVIVISNIIGGAVSIYLAYCSFSYFSIIYGNIVKALLTFVLLQKKSNIKWIFTFKMKTIFKIYEFSKNQFIYDIFTYFSRNLDNLLIGIFISKSALAFYDKAYQLSLAPNQMLTRVLTPVIQPILSEHEQNIKKIRNFYLAALNTFALISLPLSMYLVLFSREIVLFLFGSQWTNSVLVFQLLAATTWAQMITTLTPVILQSLNRSDLLKKYGFYGAFYNIFAIILGLIAKDINYMASFLSLSFIFNLLMSNYYLMKQAFGKKIFYGFTYLLTPLGNSLVLGALLFGIKHWLYNITSNSFLILATTGSFFIMYVFLIFRKKISLIKGMNLS